MRTLCSVVAILLAAAAVVLSGLDHRHVRELEVDQAELRDRLRTLEADKISHLRIYGDWNDSGLINSGLQIGWCPNGSACSITSFSLGGR